MNNNFNLMRLCCLIQDRDAQDLKRTVLSIIFEILYENNNSETEADKLYALTNEKFNTSLDKDFFDNLLLKSSSFDITNTETTPLVKLTSDKFNEIDKNISEFSIDPHIEAFLKDRKLPKRMKARIIEILFQSIYENIYTFTPNKINTLIPQNISEKIEQQDLDIFNEFIELDEPNKNRCLYNQFAKAIEFAILTSGKGVTQFSEKLYKNKNYLLDTNIIFRLIGVGGDERQKAMVQLLKDCIKQGIHFEYTHHTLLELTKKLEQSVYQIQRAEKSNSIDIIEDVLTKSPHFFNDDFITQYCRLRISKEIRSPEQYEIQMKAKFKALCKELSIEKVNYNNLIQDYEINLLSHSLIKQRKELTEFYRYSNNQAKVDAYNVLYVRKVRGANNYNYSDVKSFYLTTDRGLNRILSVVKGVLIPETILPSQLFLIHNPVSNDTSNEPDYKTFFKFLKRRTSEFKLRGKDVINYISQARLYTSDTTAISSMVEAYSDQRYKYSISDSLEEGVLLSFKEFSQTYFDKKTEELMDVKENYEEIKFSANEEMNIVIRKSKNRIKAIDIILTFIALPVIAVALKLSTSLNIYYIIGFLFLAETIKFFVSSRTNMLKSIWIALYLYYVKKTSYYKLTKNVDYLNSGLKIIKSNPDNIWK